VPNVPIIVGQISGLFGVNGAVRVFDFSRSRGDILNYSPWLLKLENGWSRVATANGSLNNDVVVVQLEGWNSRDTARELIGTEIAIQPDQLETLNEGEFYWHELEGLSVVNMEGDELGVVQYLVETGANDVLVVQGSQEILIPYTSYTIAEVDLSLRRIQVNWELDY